MLYKEFERILTAEGFKCNKGHDKILVYDKVDDTLRRIISVSTQRWRDMFIENGFEHLDSDEKIFISDLAWELACTPLDKRTEKKYPIRRKIQWGYEYLSLKQVMDVDETPTDKYKITQPIFKSEFTQREFIGLGLPCEWELEIPEDSEREDIIESDKKDGEPLKGKRVHVLRLDEVDVDFYATLIYISPTTYALVDCTDKRKESRVVANEYTYGFGKDRLDYYEVMD